MLKKQVVLAFVSIGLVLYQTDAICNYQQLPEGKFANCSGQNLDAVPLDIDTDTVILDLSDNEIHSLLEDSFESLPVLEKLNLKNNKIREVEKDSFSKLKHLHSLDMSSNPGGLRLIRNVTYGLQFTNISDVTCTNIENPYGIGKIIYADDLEYAKNTSIKRLDISGNMIEAIEDNSAFEKFPPELEVLDVSDNRPILASFVFNFYLLSNLKVLFADKLNKHHFGVSFGQNLLAETDEGTLYADTEDKVKVMNSLGKNTVSKINKNTSENMELKGCNLRLPPKLEEFYCRHSMLPFDIPKIEVCPNNSLRRFNLGHNAIFSWRGPLKGFDNIEHIDLSVNLCDSISDDFFIHMSSLKSLKVQANFIGYVIEDQEKDHPNDHPCPWSRPLTNLVSIDLYLNKIRKLPENCFSTLSNLENLILRDNSLSDWQLDIKHMPNISFLDLSGNNIGRLPKEAMDHLSGVSSHKNVTVNLRGNGLECICKDIDFLEWIDTANIQFVDKDIYMCRDNKWGKSNTTNIKQIIADLKRNCVDYTFLNTVLSILIGCFTLAVLYGIYNRYKWKLSYMYYMTWGRYNLPQDEDKEEFCYDAYISYSEEDTPFAEAELASHLEDVHGLFLYLFERDCKPGHSIRATVVDKIEKSRRIILLLSRAYVKNPHCLYEYEMANMKQMYRSASLGSVYLILLESMPHEDIPLEILKLFQSELYVEYPRDLQENAIFWERLKNTIKPSTGSFASRL